MNVTNVAKVRELNAQIRELSRQVEALMQVEATRVNENAFRHGDHLTRKEQELCTQHKHIPAIKELRARTRLPLTACRQITVAYRDGMLNPYPSLIKDLPKP